LGLVGGGGIIGGVVWDEVGREIELLWIINEMVEFKFEKGLEIKDDTLKMDEEIGW
jgi:hypothetical protein